MIGKTVPKYAYMRGMRLWVLEAIEPISKYYYRGRVIWPEDCKGSTMTVPIKEASEIKEEDIPFVILGDV